MHFITQREGGDQLEGNLSSVKAGNMSKGHGFVLTMEREEWLEGNLPSVKAGGIGVGCGFVLTMEDTGSLCSCTACLYKQLDNTRCKLTKLAWLPCLMWSDYF